MFPPANLLFVQSLASISRPPYASSFSQYTKLFFICSLEFARVNNSAALTDAKLSLDVFERLSSDLVLMSVIQSEITFFLS